MAVYFYTYPRKIFDAEVPLRILYFWRASRFTLSRELGRTPTFFKEYIFNFQRGNFRSVFCFRVIIIMII